MLLNPDQIKKQFFQIIVGLLMLEGVYKACGKNQIQSLSHVSENERKPRNLMCEVQERVTKKGINNETFSSDNSRIGQ